ncbi:MAG: hypothetical protein ACK5RO_06570, partial [Pseudobdellovibrionaceae bacterium]
MVRLRRWHTLVIVFAAFPIFFLFQNCAGDKIESLDEQQRQLASDLQSAQSRSMDLEILLRGLIETEKSQRLQADQSINKRIDELNQDLSQYKAQVNASLASLQESTASFQNQLTFTQSTMNQRISSLEVQARQLQSQLDQRLVLLDSNLRDA